MRIFLAWLILSTCTIYGYCGNSTLTWGIVNVDLNQVSSNSWVGLSKVEVNKAANIGKVGFELYNNGIRVNQLKEKHLFLVDKSRTERELAFRPNENRLTDKEFGNLVGKLEVGDSFVCVLLDDKGNQYTSVISIEPTKSVYIPPLYVPVFNKSHRFKYQLVTRYDGSQVLKIDTTLEENKKIVNAYRHIQRVSVVHYPDFETVVNFMSENDSICPLGKRNFVVHPVNKPTDDYLVVTTEPRETMNVNEFSMDWNKMVAKPDSPVFSAEYLKNIGNHSIYLFGDNKRYDIVGMRWAYLDGRNLNKAFYWKKGEAYPIDMIKDMSGPFSVLIDRIVVHDSRYGYIYIPQAFLYNFQ